MRAGIDIMGGDYAPSAALEGVSLALRELPDEHELVLIGDEAIINEYVEKNHTGGQNVKVVAASQVIGMSDSPTRAIQQKTDSSIAKGFRMLHDAEIDVFMSAGNTGAMLVGALYSIKAIPGVLRPAITSLIPKENGGYGIILDVGANLDCKQEVLVQFAMLGSIYSKNVYHIPQPKVGLLNIGSEREKGNIVTQATYPLLEEHSKINFIGNIEGYDLFSDAADVIVCDGFTGNVVLKAAESIRHIMKRRGLTDEYFDKFDYENYGGTPILGVNKPVLIGHGVSSPTAFKSMIMLGRDMVESQVIGKIRDAFES
ncbi:MAG: phosphate acyltransferase PlsX [Bacteroidia bacterium]